MYTRILILTDTFHSIEIYTVSRKTKLDVSSKTISLYKNSAFFTKTLLFVPSQIQRICKTHTACIQTAEKERETGRKRARKIESVRVRNGARAKTCITSALKWETENQRHAEWDDFVRKNHRDARVERERERAEK